MAVLRAKVGSERDNPLLEEIITIRSVGFGLLVCGINAQLPRTLLGSPSAQGVRHTSDVFGLG